MLNSCNFNGRLVYNPELRHTPTGVAVCSITVAVSRNRPTKSGEWLTDFLEFDCWRGLAEKVAKYSKGDLLALSGSLEIHPYTDKNNVKRNKAVIVADFVQRIQSRNSSNTSNDPFPLSPPPVNDDEGYHEIPEEPGDGELPF